MLLFEKRENVSTKLKVAIPLISVFLGLVAGGIAILFTRTNPLIVYQALVKGAFSSVYTFSETLVVAIPLILISAGLIVAFKMNFWNIGAYGQYIVETTASCYYVPRWYFGRSSLGIDTCCVKGLLGSKRSYFNVAFKLYRTLHIKIFDVWSMEKSGKSRLPTIKTI